MVLKQELTRGLLKKVHTQRDPCRRQHASVTTAKTLVYMDTSKVIHLVPNQRYEQNTFIVSRMGPRHTGHIGVLVLVSCSTHASHTRRCLHGSTR
jgi:hypothetical protein